MLEHLCIPHIHFSTVDSTNTWVKNHLDLLDDHVITCVTADQQSHGRGRFERTWFSPKDVNIYATYHLCVNTSSPFLASIGQIMVVSCSKLLEDLSFSPFIKWPNDLLLEGRKIAGVLCETVLQKNKVHVIAGIGINVNMGSTLLNSIEKPATSLQEISGTSWNVSEILQKLTKYFLTELRNVETQGVSSILTYLNNHLAFRGNLLTIQDGVRKITGICSGINSNGHLLLQSETGALIEVYAGTILSF